MTDVVDLIMQGNVNGLSKTSKSELTSGTKSYNLLHLAAVYGKIDVIKYLLSVGEFLESKDINGNTSLMLATSNFGISSNEATIRGLLKLGANPYIENYSLFAPLDVSRQEKIIAGEKISTASLFEDFPLDYIPEEYSIVENLKRHRRKINTKELKDKNKIVDVLLNGTTHQLEQSLNNLGNINYVSPRHAQGYSLLHFSIRLGDVDKLNLILSHQPDPNIQDKEMNNALMHFLKFSRYYLEPHKIINNLLEAGARTDLENIRGISPEIILNQAHNGK